ncbi:MAG: phosphotransferase [Coprobacillus sp.]|nr:phosphotransferase [Coprobacillus sp.]
MEPDREILDDIFNKDYEIDHQQIGGMTNISYIIASCDKKYVYYIPATFANETINRSDEFNVYMEANMYGLSSYCLYFDKKSGVKVSEYIEGESLDKVESYDIRDVCQLLHDFHALSPEATTLDLRKNLEMYLSYVKRNTLDRNYYLLEQYLYRSLDYLESFPKCLCHHDFQKSNIIKGVDNHYYVIDFEFSSYGDPLYDVAAFANNSMEEGIMLLKEYCGGSPTQEEYKRFYLYRLYLSLQWYIVATIKARNRESDALGIDFEGVGRFFLDNAMTCKQELDKF